jgi:hypothetical protein
MSPSPSLGAPLLSESPSPPPFWGIPGSALFAAGAAGVAGAAALGGAGAAAGSLAFGAGVVAVGTGVLAGVAAGALGVVLGVIVGVTLGVVVSLALGVVVSVALGVVVTAAAGVVGVLAGVAVVVPVLAELLAAEPQPATTSAAPTALRPNNARGIVLRGLPVGSRVPASIGAFKIRVFRRIMGVVPSVLQCESRS